MRVPSRRMAPAAVHPVKWYGWLFLATLPLLFGWLVWLHPYVVGGFLGVVTVMSRFLNYEHRRYLKQVATLRQGQSICEFARYFDRRHVDPWIIRAVYQELGRTLPVRRFPLHPGDALEDDLRIDPDDLGEVLMPVIAERTGRSLAEPDRNPLYGHVTTVADLVHFFEAQPRVPQPNNRWRGP